MKSLEVCYWYVKIPSCVEHGLEYINVLVQERRNSIANAQELRLPCTNTSISCFMFKNI